MNVKTLAFASAGAVLIAGAAFGDHLSIEGDGVTSFEYGDFDATGLQVCRLYVAGLNDGDSVLSVSGIPGSMMNINANGSIFNALELGQTHFAGNSALFPTFPELQWDTWLAIGDETANVSPGFPNVALAGGGADVVDNANAAWFNGDPGSPAFADNGNVMIGQFSFADTDTMYFSANIQIIRADGSEEQIWVEGEFNHIPAPGALALLGVAGLAGTRRRRG